MPDPDFTKRRIINPGAVAFPAWWERRPQSAFMAAMATVVARIGFAATRVEDIVELARASRRTFYVHFDNIEECLMATHGAIVKDALAAVDAHPRSADDALAELMGYLAAWPGHAHVLLITMPAAGPMALRRHESALQALAERLARCVEPKEPTPGQISHDQLLQARFGAAQRLVLQQVVAGEHRALPHLVPVLSAVMSSLALE